VDAEHQRIRWLLAPLVSAILTEVARDRGCRVHDLSASLTAAVESAALAWYRGYLEDQEQVTPAMVYEAQERYERASQRPTTPPKGVWRKR